MIGVFYGLLSFLCFSIMNASNKYVSFFKLANLNSWLIYKNSFSLIIIFVVGIVIWKKSFFKSTNYKAVWIRALILAINQICTIFAVKYLSLDMFYSITFLMPLMITFFGIIALKESPSSNNLIALLLGLIGSLIIMQPQLHSPQFIGIILTFIVVLSGASSAIIVKKYLPQENPVSSSMYIYILAVLISFLISDGTTKIIYDVKIIAFSLFVAIIGILATLLFMKAYQKSLAYKVAPTQYTQMIWGIIFGYAFFNDIPYFYTLIGSVVIIIANYINLSKKNFFIGFKKNDY